VQTIGQKLRELREKENLLLRQVAASIEMDTALLSKIERDERKPSKEQVLAFAKYYKMKPDELLVAWLSDKLASEVKDEDFALKAIQVAEEKVKYHKSKK
jgi:transcriptional regulator with XRE-family HTH domain